MSSDDAKEALERQLALVADRLLRNTFKQAGDEDECKKYPILAQVVKGLVGEQRWQRSPSQAVIDTLRVALGRVPEKFTGRAPEQSAGNNFWKGKPERRAAEILYGYRDDELPKRFHDDGSEMPRTYEGSYLPTVLELVGAQPQTKSAGRITKVIRQDLANALLDLTSKDVLFGVGTPNAQTVAPHVPRAAEESEVAEWLTSGERLAVIFGDSGTGKSHLANHVLDMHCRANDIQLIALDAATPYRLFDTMSRHLGNTSSADLAKLKFDFVLVLRQAQRNSILFIDNVSEWSQVEDFIEPAPRCIITAETPIAPSSIPHRRIRIEGLLSEECASLVRHFQANVTDLDAIDLWAAVAGNPQLILDSLSMADAERMSIAEVCECFGSDTSDIARIIGKGSRAVDKQYRMYYSGLRERNLAAALFLTTVVYLDQPYVTLSIIAEVWQRACSALDLNIERPDSEAKLLALLIEERSVLRVVDGHVVSHHLTRRIFRSVEPEHKVLITQALFDSYDAEYREHEDFVVRDSLEWVPAIGTALLTSPVSTLLDIVSTASRLNQVMISAYTGYYQLGDFMSARSLINRFLTDSNYFDLHVARPFVILRYYRSEFQLGGLDRVEFSAIVEAMIDDDYGLFSTESAKAQFSWYAARVRYRHQEAFLSSQRSIIPILEHGTSEEQRREALTETMYDNIESLAYLGHMNDAIQMCYAYVQDKQLGVSMMRRLRAAVAGCRMSILSQNYEIADSMLAVARESYRLISAKTRLAQADALMCLVEAWSMRRHLVSSKELILEVIEKFLKAGFLHTSAGFHRDAFEAYGEAVTLTHFGVILGVDIDTVPGLDFTPVGFTNYVVEHALAVGEGHVALRIEAAGVFANGVMNGPTMDDIAYLEAVATRSAESCEDARTYQQATFCAAITRLYMGLRLRPQMLDAMIEVMLRGNRGLTPERCREIVLFIIRNAKYYVLLM